MYNSENDNRSQKIILFNPNTCVELRVLGPEGESFVDLENKYTKLFEEQQVYFMAPRLLSAPQKTTVAIAIGIGVLTGAGTHLVTKLIDEIFSIKENKPNIEIHIDIKNGNNYFLIEGSKEDIIEKLKEYNEDDDK